MPPPVYKQVDMRRFMAVCAWLAIAGCTSSSQAASAVSSPSPSPFAGGSPSTEALKVAGGCGATQVYKGGEPDWLTRAGDNNNPTDVPYAITSPANAAGFLFSYPLRSGSPNNPGNKILWVVAIPRNGNDLLIDAHPLNAATPVVHMSFPANSSPGEIYPSEDDVPSPGCWHFDLTWGPNHGTVELVYA